MKQVNETIIKYRGYTLRIIPRTRTIMAIPSDVICVYYPINKEETENNAFKQVKIILDEVLEKLKTI